MNIQEYNIRLIRSPDFTKNSTKTTRQMFVEDIFEAPTEPCLPLQLIFLTILNEHLMNDNTSCGSFDVVYCCKAAGTQAEYID